MKILYLMRHSIRDGQKNTVGPRGLQLAYEQGKTVNSNLDISLIAGATDGDKTVGLEKGEKRFAKLFHGPQVQSAQTAIAFCLGLGYIPAIMPIVFGLGDSDLFAKIMTGKFIEAVKSGLSNFQAIRQVHGDAQAKIWGGEGRSALMEMFDNMKDGEAGLGFFYSTPVELTAWACGAEQSGVKDWNVLSEMEGLIFICEGDKIRVTGKA